MNANSKKPDRLPCGCRRCGCACPTHAGVGVPPLCDFHAAAALGRFLLGEAATLVALGLFVSAVIVWTAILS